MIRLQIRHYLLFVAVAAGVIRIGMIWWAYTHYTRGLAYRVLSEW